MIHFAEHNEVLDETIRDLHPRVSLANGFDRDEGLKDRPAEEPDQEQSETNVSMPDVTAFGADASVERFEKVVLDAPAQVRKLAQFGGQESEVSGEDPIGLRLSGVFAFERNFDDARDVEWIFQLSPRHAANRPDLVFDVADGVDTFCDHDSRFLGIRCRVDVGKEILGPSDRLQTSVVGFDDQVHVPEGNCAAKVDPVGHEAVVEDVSGKGFAHGLNRPPHHPACGRQFRPTFSHRLDVETACEFVPYGDQSAGEQSAKAAPVRDAGTAGSAGGEMERQAPFRSSLGVDSRGGAAKRVQVPSFERSAQGRIGDDGLSFAGKDVPESREAQSLIQRQKTAATPRHLVHEHLEDRGSRNNHVRSSAVLLAIGPKRDLEKTLGEMFKALQRRLFPSRSLLLASFTIFSNFFDFFRIEAGGAFLLARFQRRGEVLGQSEYL
jgi:hypothetical protein